MDIYVARQPIFNRKRRIYGYELLFRDGISNAFPDIDGHAATSKVLSHSFFSMGMDRITGGKAAFINFTAQLLEKKIPLLFPKDKLIVEILEDVEAVEPVVQSCRELHSKGYLLALDDFLYKKELEPLMALADIIKIDFLLTPPDELANVADKLLPFGAKLLAEKVETHEEFHQALDLGFEYFQGYFFSKPEILKGKSPSPSKLALLQIMAEANREDFRFSEIERVIQRDVDMSYKLMRYINSAYFRRAQEISSMKQAMVLLGEKEIRRFVSLMALANLVEDKPDELVRASIIRAKLCELLGRDNPSQVDEGELFTVGLFSLIDAILDDHIENLMEALPLSGNIKSALVKGEGKLAGYLRIARCYEGGDWEEFARTATEMRIDVHRVPQSYMDAVAWAESLASL
ncbi:MAG: HDOD domain-containing protein [Deltaproteobacteria bacterium]|nr:HDOD domain-containing protein [Deltaproteobacteria bacterium]